MVEIFPGDAAVEPHEQDNRKEHREDVDKPERAILLYAQVVNEYRQQDKLQG